MGIYPLLPSAHSSRPYFRGNGIKAQTLCILSVFVWIKCSSCPVAQSRMCNSGPGVYPFVEIGSREARASSLPEPRIRLENLPELPSLSIRMNAFLPLISSLSCPGTVSTSCLIFFLFFHVLLLLPLLTRHTPAVLVSTSAEVSMC